MNIYQTIKAAVTTRQAAEHYGVECSRSGMSRCPFQDDRTPSMKLDARFHCFGCQADGDVIDSTARLFSISKYEAAKKLAADFGVTSDYHAPPASHNSRVTTIPAVQNERQWLLHATDVLIAYEKLLKEWRRRYAHSDQEGRRLQCKRNCVTVLENDPHLKGAFRCNILSGRTDIVRDLGWRRPSPAINDTDMSYIYLYMEDHYSLTSEKHIDSAIRIVADKNSYHPVCAFLDNLIWDGQERISKLLPRFFGVSTDDGYYTPQLLYDCTKLFLMDGIARAHNPGIKFDYMLCLAGGQGAGKSTFFRYLAHNDDWFTDDLKKIDDDNIYRQLQGHWICEMPEMIEPSNPRKRDQVKAFITRQKDSYKVPYDVYPMDRPRQCIFGGTTNIVQFLPFDRTGNRRFIPIEINEERREVHILDKNRERENRYFIDQVWAEAMALYRSGDYTLALSTEHEHRRLDRGAGSPLHQVRNTEIMDTRPRCLR